jgi:CoA-transferase family III
MALAWDRHSPSGWAAASAWARSGVMALCGWPEGPPLLPPLGLPAHLDGISAEIARLTEQRGRRVTLSWASLMAGRAALLSLRRGGRNSANGTCRLLPSADGWVALNLARPDDVDLVPALTGLDRPDPWEAVAAAAAAETKAGFVDRSRLLGLPAAALPEPQWGAGPDPVPDGVLEAARCPAQARGETGSWTVVDFSSLWAGPIVARILAAAGATVIKVEGASRPDGARAIPSFYRWLHDPGEKSVTVDLGTGPGRQRAGDLIDAADVVIEGSRPRALEQLGLGPYDRPGPAGQVWLSLTGHGREGPGRDWVAFGDDAAIAGGLALWDGEQPRGRPVFFGDAVADPLSGLVGALAVLRARDAGGGQLIDLAMSRVAAAMSTAGRAERVATDPPDAAIVERWGAGAWRIRVGGEVEPIRDRPPTMQWISA